MNTITKQWLQQKIAAMEATRDEIPFGLDEDDSNTLAAMRIALASLEAEAVAWLLSGGGAKNHVSFDSGNAYADPLREVTPLYTAPPAPVSVPDVMAGKSFEYIANTFQVSISEAQWILVGWNACRAAMLQAEPVSNRDELPLDYLQGQKDGLEWAAQLAEANHPQTGDWLYDDPIELARAIRKGPDMPTSQAGNSPVTPDGWINCRERLPKPNKYVLVCNGVWVGVGMYNNAEHFEDDERWQDEHGEFIDLLHHPVTHWQLLPTAPQQEVNRG